MSKFQVGDNVKVKIHGLQDFIGKVTQLNPGPPDFYLVCSDNGLFIGGTEHQLELIPTYVARPQITIGAHAAATQHLGELAGQELADALMNDIQELCGLPKCECGAHATSFQDNHSNWCPMFESRS